MLYTRMELDYCVEVLKDKLPILYEFIECCDFFNFDDACRLIGGIERVDSEKAIENICNHIETCKKNAKRRIAFFPAGGLSEEVLSSCDLSAIEIIGFFDSYKASKADTYKGYHLYPLDEIGSHKFDSLILLSSAIADEIYDTISNISKKIANKTYIPFLTHTIERERCRQAIERINRLCSSNKDKQVVIFAVERFYVNFLKRIEYLRKNGVITILMTCNDDVSHGFPLASIEDCFDYTFSSEGDYLSFLYILRKVKPDLVHLMPVGLHFEFSVLIGVLSTCPIICEFHDILSTMHKYESLEKMIGTYRSKIQFESERFLCENSDGIMYKNSDLAFDTLQGKYDITAPSLQFQAYIPTEYIAENTSKLENDLSFVYAGGVYTSVEAGGDATFYLYEVIDILTEQGFRFDIYNVYDTDNGAYNNYVRKGINNKLFAYHLPVENKYITRVLSQYHMGWHVFDLSNSIINMSNYSITMTTKFFDYLSAGLPIIVSRELAYLTELVVEFGIGIPVSFNELLHLRDIISQYDLDELRENVKKVQVEWSMDKHINRLVNFYNAVS